MDQVGVIHDCLNLFCSSSGQKVSKEKTKIFFSRNVNHVRTNEIASAFGFSLTHDLGKYLGVPLQHRATFASSFSYITEKIMQCLSC